MKPRPTSSRTAIGVLASAAALATTAAPAAPARLPNLLVIMADDLGYGDLGCYGSRAHATPVLDQLARDGVRFTDFYMTSAVCTPSRVALLTGRHPARVGLHQVLWPPTPGGLPEEERTLPEILSEHGYLSALAGKWHLGHSEPRHLPQNHGFDSFYGMPYPNDMGPAHNRAVRMGEVWPPMPMMRGTTIVESPIDVNLLTQQYTAEAVRFIAENHHRPFFLFLAHAMPHTIIGASPDFVGSSGNGLYGDAVQEVDWSTGEVLRALRAFSLLEHTLVVFTSDNGAVLPAHYDAMPEAARAMHPDLTFGSNTPLRGGKQSTFEGGVRVPAIVSWPGVIPGGGTIHTAAWVADLLPTFLEFAGLPQPSDRSLDGASLRSLLLGEGERPATDFHFGTDKITAIRSGDWKLVLPAQPRFIRFESAKPMLFHLRDDPGEQTDLAAKHPDQAADLHARLITFEAAAAADAAQNRTDADEAAPQR